ncbi:MAG: hypothetical protein QXD95_03565 [Nitrososphaeria archaeon]
MSLTIKLLRTIGSPFASEQTLANNYDEAIDLYTYAIKNKIGLFYLKALKDRGKLGQFESEYKEQSRKYNEILTTITRSAKLLDSAGIKYAIFKSILPYPAIPNDVDIIVFGSDNEYKEAKEVMLQAGYKIIGIGPHQIMFHDIRGGDHIDPYKKDVYDIDLYQNVSASHLIYLDKRKLAENVTEIRLLNGERIKVLTPETELMTMILHSIIPEQLYTFFVYYATLYHLVKMNSDEIYRFINIVRENNVTFPVMTHYSLVEELHQAAYGFVPQKIEKILSNLGNKTIERKNFVKNDFKMPHRYSLLTIIISLLEKSKEYQFRRSAARQFIDVLNPKSTTRVISDFIRRRKRETY